MPPYVTPRQKRQPKIVRLLRSRTSSILVAAVLVVMLYFLFSTKGFLSRIELESDIADKSLRVIDLERDIQRLTRERDMLREDRATIEHVARENHGMMKKGEIVYRILPAERTKKK